MPTSVEVRPDGHRILDRQHLDTLIHALSGRGYRVIGPTVGNGAILYDEVDSTDDLPIGIGELQEAATYRLRDRGDDSVFGYAVGPHSWKRYMHPPRVAIWSGRRAGSGFEPEEPEEPPRYAFFGVRPCEVAAIEIQDRVFLDDHPDRVYGERRRSAFVVAVECTVPGGTCFCSSMGTGPGVESGFDLRLTEIVTDDRHVFLVVPGSAEGDEVLAEVPTAAADATVTAEADALVSGAADRMGRSLNTEGIKDLLYRNSSHPQWETVARRCLSCGNCTSACPTCFCTTVEDGSSLDGEHAWRLRRWDSCFSMQFSFIHGGPLRRSPASRYRQWLTHKLAGWIDQFGTSGCVGCGRCITWCPVGIDITEEVRTIGETEEAARVRSRPTP